MKWAIVLFVAGVTVMVTTLSTSFLLAFVGIWAGILGFLAFWVVLFTGSYPQSWFEFQVKLMKKI
jgi:hypothetical protein